MSEQPVTTTEVQNLPEQQTFTQNEPLVPPSKVTGQSDPKFYTEEDLVKAREQEKSKVYRRLETLQETVKRLEEDQQRRMEAERARQVEIEEENRRKAEEEMSAKDLIAQKEAQWHAEQEELRQQIEQERALRERESQYAELMAYREDVLDRFRDRIAPELLDLVGGSTPEEIVQSAEDMATRTDRILAQSQEAMQNARQQMPTARVTAPASADDTGAQRNYTPDEIRQMSMSEYSKHRARLLGQGASGGPKSRGLFG